MAAFYAALTSFFFFIVLLQQYQGNQGKQGIVLGILRSG
jgi:hypothetical protein